MKEFKEILKKEKHPFIMEQTLSNIYNIIFVLTMLSLLFLQINNIITGSIGAIGIIILLITAIPMWTLEVKRDNRLKSMKDHYTKKKTISKVKNNLNLIKTLLIIEIISFLGLSGYILAECVFKNEMPIINYQEPYKITIKEEEVVELERYNFDNDNFSFIVPSSFTAMDKDTIKRKYPHGNPPSLVLSNEKTNINILLGATDSELKNNQVKGYVKAMKKELEEVAEIIEINYYERDDHEIGEIKFVSQAVDTEVYNHMLIFSVNDYLRIVSFNCTKALQNDWQEASEYIMHSLMFKKDGLE